MSEDAFDKACKELALQQQDPLGETRRYAKQLWLADGSPDSGNWEHYWQEAQKRFSVAPGLSLELQAQSPQEAEIKSAPPANLPPLAATIAATVKLPLAEHDGYCLAVLLRDCTFNLAAGIALGPFSMKETADLLTTLQPHIDWQAQVGPLFESDQTLTNHDRLTIARLRQTLLQGGSVEGIVPVRQPKTHTTHADGSDEDIDLR